MPLFDWTKIPDVTAIEAESFIHSDDFNQACSALKHEAKKYEFLKTKMAEKFSPLYVAILLNKGDFVEKLLNSKPELLEETEPNGAKPIWAAASQDNLAMLDSLIAKGAKIDDVAIPSLLKKDGSVLKLDQNISLLFACCTNGKSATVGHLMKNYRDRIDVNEVSIFKRTPLMAASFSGKEDIVDFLVVGGANLMAKDDTERLAIDHAILGGHDNVACILFLSCCGSLEEEKIKELERSAVAKNLPYLADAIERHQLRSLTPLPEPGGEFDVEEFFTSAPERSR